MNFNFGCWFFQAIQICTSQVLGDLEVSQQAHIYTKGRFGTMNIIDFEEIHTNNHLKSDGKQDGAKLNFFFIKEFWFKIQIPHLMMK